MNISSFLRTKFGDGSGTVEFENNDSSFHAFQVHRRSFSRPSRRCSSRSSVSIKKEVLNYGTDQMTMFDWDGAFRTDRDGMNNE
jgi:hypothetical protein